MSNPPTTWAGGWLAWVRRSGRLEFALLLTILGVVAARRGSATIT